MKLIRFLRNALEGIVKGAGSIILFALSFIAVGIICLAILYGIGWIAIHMGFPASALQCNPPSNLNTHVLTGYIISCLICALVFIYYVIRSTCKQIKKTWDES
jgi:hypothetical protein